MFLGLVLFFELVQSFFWGLLGLATGSDVEERLFGCREKCDSATWHPSHHPIIPSSHHPVKEVAVPGSAELIQATFSEEWSKIHEGYEGTITLLYLDVG